MVIFDLNLSYSTDSEFLLKTEELALLPLHQAYPAHLSNEELV